METKSFFLESENQKYQIILAKKEITKENNREENFYYIQNVIKTKNNKKREEFLGFIDFLEELFDNFNILELEKNFFEKIFYNNISTVRFISFYPFIKILSVWNKVISNKKCNKNTTKKIYNLLNLLQESSFNIIPNLELNFNDYESHEDPKKANKSILKRLQLEEVKENNKKLINLCTLLYLNYKMAYFLEKEGILPEKEYLKFEELFLNTVKKYEKFILNMYIKYSENLFIGKYNIFDITEKFLNYSSISSIIEYRIVFSEKKSTSDTAIKWLLSKLDTKSILHCNIINEDLKFLSYFINFLYLFNKKLSKEINEDPEKSILNCNHKNFSNFIHIVNKLCDHCENIRSRRKLFFIVKNYYMLQYYKPHDSYISNEINYNIQEIIEKCNLKLNDLEHRKHQFHFELFFSIMKKKIQKYFSNNAINYMDFYYSSDQTHFVEDICKNCFREYMKKLNTEERKTFYTGIFTSLTCNLFGSLFDEENYDLISKFYSDYIRDDAGNISKNKVTFFYMKLNERVFIVEKYMKLMEIYIDMAKQFALFEKEEDMIFLYKNLMKILKMIENSDHGKKIDKLSDIVKTKIENMFLDKIKYEDEFLLLDFLID